MSRRVAITGIGLVTPVGADREGTWSALLEGRSGAGPITLFEAGGFPVRIGAEVDAPLPALDRLAPAELGTPYRRLAKYTSRATRFALAAAEEAFEDAGLQPGAEDATRWGCVVGAGMQTVSFEELETVRRFCGTPHGFEPAGLLDPAFPADPIVFGRSLSNTGLALLVQRFGLRGFASAVHTACASGGQALGTALDVVRRGEADRVLAGGYDSMLNPMGLSGFCLLGALSTDNDTPQRASRPFDLTRNGFVLGEGAGFLVLEEWSAARARGARIHAELAGSGNTLSGYRITDSPPDGDGALQAMERALRDAGAAPEELDYVNAHGTSTPMNDASECAALHRLLGDDVRRVATSSTKSCTGHLIAAAGAVEAAVCALAIRDGRVPVNANLEERDPACDVELVTGASRERPVRLALSSSLGFGGTNNALVLRAPERVPAP